MKLLLLVIVFFTNISLSYASNEAVYNSIINAYDNNNWVNLKKFIKHADKDVSSLAYWLYVKDANKSGASFEEIYEFLEKHNNFPEHKKIITNAELAINFDSNYTYVTKWCQKHLPSVGNSKKVCYFNFASHIKDQAQKNEYYRKAWIYGDFKPEEEQKFLQQYSKILLKDDNTLKIQRLLWEDKLTQAKSLYPRLNDSGKLLADIVNKIRSGKIPNIPDLYKKNHLIIYSLMNYNYKREHLDRVNDLIIQAGHDVPYAEKWSNLRRIRAREAINHKNYHMAYNLIKNHNLKNGKEFAESEWLAGWISLTFLHDAKSAVRHFSNLHKNVKYSLSKVRAAYWLAESYKKLNDHENSNKWYVFAAKHPEFFYGQMALIKLNRKTFELPKNVVTNNQDLAEARKIPHYRIAYNLFKSQNDLLAQKFLMSAIHHYTSPKMSYLIAKMPLDVKKHKHMSVELSKEASQFGHLFVDIGYPLIKKDNYLVEIGMISALIRQESNFHQYAKSNVGALGLMQIMPDTGKELAKQTGFKYNVKKLTQDSQYNVMLGQYYLHKLLNVYDSSEILTLMAYNAGPGNVKKWLNEMGNPIKLKTVDQVVNWIEMVPWSQPREYVHKILGNLQVYRAKMNGNLTHHPIWIKADLFG